MGQVSAVPGVTLANPRVTPYTGTQADPGHAFGGAGTDIAGVTVSVFNGPVGPTATYVLSTYSSSLIPPPSPSFPPVHLASLALTRVHVCLRSSFITLCETSL